MEIEQVTFLFERNSTLQIRTFGLPSFIASSNSSGESCARDTALKDVAHGGGFEYSQWDRKQDFFGTKLRIRSLLGPTAFCTDLWPHQRLYAILEAVILQLLLDNSQRGDDDSSWTYIESIKNYCKNVGESYRLFHLTPLPPPVKKNKVSRLPLPKKVPSVGW